MTELAAPLPRAERLDRLPFTREHGRLVVGSGIGWALLTFLYLALPSAASIFVRNSSDAAISYQPPS